ncbi:hypothetical protein [Pontibacter russatus]|uniref:hypothetical protein n=1 Tax=Pontibacter russatus TaxID=2694929 RepID=UPI00137B7672|nr:hypothetical protein [Pontibacter russatus]
MEYRFIHYWQYEPGEEENQVLEEAISLSMKARDENFLRELASFISEHTSVRHVIIGRLSDDYQHIRTCVFLKEKEVLKNITYPLQGTPCESLLTQRFCYFPLDVAQNFPEDKEIKSLGVESYLGSLLLSEDNEPIGMVALMDVKPIEKAAFAEHLILVLSPAIEQELVRRRA